MVIISDSGNFYDVKEIKESDEFYFGVDYSILRDYQVKVAENILDHTCGICQVPTGWGKTWLIAWLCRYLPRPILITEPTYALCEEISTRMQSMKIDLEGIRLINPTGYMAHKERDDSWMEEVQTILSDETSVTSSMEYILEHIVNTRFWYSFNYTPDRWQNMNLKFLHDYKLSDSVCKTLKYFGPTLVYEKMKKDIEINIEEMHLGNCRFKVEEYENWKYKKATDLCFRSRALIPYVSRVINQCDSPILFPYTDHKQIEWIFNHPDLSRYRMCIWSSGTLRLNNGRVFNRKNKWNGLSPYMTVKYLVDKNQVDLIFCSSVAFKGVDLPKLSNLILMISSNAGNTIQIVGRICRSDKPRIFLPKNLDNNPLYEASFNKRLKWIKTLVKEVNSEPTYSTFNDPIYGNPPF